MTTMIVIQWTDEEAAAAAAEFAEVSDELKHDLYPNGLGDYLAELVRHAVLRPMVLRQATYAQAALVDQVRKLDPAARAQIEALVASKAASADAPAAVQGSKP